MQQEQVSKNNRLICSISESFKKKKKSKRLFLDSIQSGIKWTDVYTDAYLLISPTEAQVQAVRKMNACNSWETSSSSSSWLWGRSSTTVRNIYRENTSKWWKSKSIKLLVTKKKIFYKSHYLVGGSDFSGDLNFVVLWYEDKWTSTFGFPAANRAPEQSGWGKSQHPDEETQRHLRQVSKGIDRHC